MTHHEESEGLASASKFEIIALCEGQPALESNLRDQGILIGESEPDEFAKLGTAIHKARETGDTSELSEEGLEIFNRGMLNEHKILTQWKAKKQISDVVEFKEQRIWLYWPGTENKATSAKLDVHYIEKDALFSNPVLVVEWKSLYCTNLTPAERNYQGMVQAVCASKYHGSDNVRVAFNKAMFGESDIVDYGPDDLRRAEQHVFQKLWATKQAGAATNAGHWCVHCPCKPYCKSAAAYSLLPSVSAGVTVDTSKKDVGLAVSRLSPIDWKAIWERSAVIRNVLDAVNTQLKALPQEKLAELGLQLGKGKRLDPITNVQGAFKYLEHQMRPELIWSCLKMSKTDLVEAVADAKGMTKKEAQDWVRDNLDVFITPKESEKSVEEME